jgi:hypothetical protein
MSDAYIEQRDGAYMVAGTRVSLEMPRHFADFVRPQRSPGLIVVPQHLP